MILAGFRDRQVQRQGKEKCGALTFRYFGQYGQQLMRRIDEPRLTGSSDFNDPLGIFLNSLGAHIAITLCVKEDKNEGRD